MRSGGSAAPAASKLVGPVLARAPDSGLFAGIALAVVLAGREEGAFEIDVWALLGLALLIVVTAFLLLGHRPGRAVTGAAAALVFLGVWSVASTAWGGLPDPAWTFFNQALIAAGALLLGSILGPTARRGKLVLAAVLAGIVAQAVEVLARLAAGSSPETWFRSRSLEGPVGYANGQALLFALGVLLALHLVASERAGYRLAGGGATGILVGALLLTQSRGVLLALALAIAVQLAGTRNLRPTLFVVPLLAAFAGLVVALRDVDEALLEASAAGELTALRRYVIWTALAAIVLAGLAWATARAARVGRALPIALAIVLAVGAVSAAAVERRALADAADTLLEAPSDTETDPDVAPAGSTRLPSLSFNGRLEAWRVGRDLAGEHPLAGAGQGQFARTWTADRRLTGLYILRPHSIELELLSELGAVGLGAFLAFLAITITALLRAPDRALAGAALGVTAVLVAHASFDVTWSLQGVVFPGLLVLGAAAGGRPAMRLSLVRKALVGLVTVVLAISFGAPYLADRQVELAEASVSSDAPAARRHADAARKLNPWDPRPLSLQGRLEEASGAFPVAVERYRAASELSSLPWLEHFNEARALMAAGATPAGRAACRRAGLANPGERLLRTGACEYEVEGNLWPVVRVSPAGSGAAEDQFDAFYKDEDCARCGLAFAGQELEAAIEGGSVYLDTAYGERLLGDADGLSGRVYARDVVRLPRGETLSGNIRVLQMRDVRQIPVYELYIDEDDGTLSLFSAQGALGSQKILVSTGVAVPTDGVSSLRVEVAALAGESLIVRVDGVERIRLSGLGDTVTRGQRYLRVGIMAYESPDTSDEVRVYHSRVDVGQKGWLGP